MIELALPAGSLSGALTALQNGADAVYFGLKDFSARKGAVNFSEEDLSKIRRYSHENNKDYKKDGYIYHVAYNQCYTSFLVGCKELL